MRAPSKWPRAMSHSMPSHVDSVGRYTAKTHHKTKDYSIGVPLQVGEALDHRRAWKTTRGAHPTPLWHCGRAHTIPEANNLSLATIFMIHYVMVYHRLTIMLSSKHYHDAVNFVNGPFVALGLHKLCIPLTLHLPSTCIPVLIADICNKLYNVVLELSSANR